MRRELAALIADALPTVSIRYGVPTDQDEELITYNIEDTDTETFCTLTGLNTYAMYAVQIHITSLLMSTLDTYTDAIREALDDYNTLPFDGILFDTQRDNITETKCQCVINYNVYYIDPILGSAFSTAFDQLAFS